MGRAQLTLALIAAFGLGSAAGWWLRGSEPAGQQDLRSPARGLAETTGLCGIDDLELPAEADALRLAPPPTSTSPVRSRMPSDARTGALTISGTVQDGIGKPLRQANVLLETSEGPRSARPEGVDGSFGFEDLDAGEYVLSVKDRDYHEFRKTLSLSAPHPQVFERIVLDPKQRLTVRVVTPDGAPYQLSFEDSRRIEGLSREDAQALGLRWGGLTVCTMENPPATLEQVEGGGDGGSGRFERRSHSRFQGLEVIGDVVLDRPPPIHVCLFRGWMHIDSRPVRTGDTEVSFVVDPALLAARYGDIRLRLVDDHTGEPIMAKVHLRHTSSSGGSWKTGSDGSCTHSPADPGEYSLEVRSTKHVSVERTVHVAPGEVLDLGVIRLQPSPTIRGRIVDSHGVGVTGMIVRFGLLAGEGPEPLSFHQQRTDEEGRFELGGMVPGRMLLMGRLEVQGSAMLRTVPLVVDTREAVSEELVLPAVPATEVELFPGRDSALTYRIEDAGGVIMDTGSVHRRPETLWLLPGDYAVLLADRDGLEQRMSFSVGSGWTQVRLP